MPIKLVFFGSDAIALPLLNWLVGEGSETAEVVAVFTQPDRPIGRGQKIATNAIKQWALARNLPVHQPEKIGREERQRLVELSADVSLVMAYGHILKEDFIATPRLGTLNLHASLLPSYRGASPIQSAIAAGESATGVSLMRIVRELDAGPVADVERVPIAPTDTALDIEAKLGAGCVSLLRRNLPRFAARDLVFVEQDHAAATFCRRLIKADGVVDFEQPARLVAARINGLFPWPGCGVSIEQQTIKLGQADWVEGEAEPGRIVGNDAHGLLVGTAGGLVRLRQMQRPGGRMLPGKEFLRGFPVAAGAQIVSRGMAILVSPQPFRR